MKKYLIALLLGIGLMAMQTASAATLTLSGANPSVSVFQGTHDVSVLGSVPAGTSLWLSTNDNFSNQNVTVGSPFSFTGAGDVLLGAVGGALVNFSLTFTGGGAIALFLTDEDGNAPPVNGVPVPAAVWLFGSALMGLVGVARRKNQPAGLAA
jgi:hypothetical protein